jgi:ankyrin repeat protein
MIKIKPDEWLASDDTGQAIWDTLLAGADGDLAALRRLLERDPRLSRAEYWYTSAIHFAAREGHVDTVRFLLDSGADPEWNGLHDGSLIEMARERGHEEIARALEQGRDRRGRVVPQAADHPIHAAAARGDADAVRALLDADASIIDVGDWLGGTALHRAVLGGSPQVVALLLDHGANMHAVQSSARGLPSGLVHDLQAIDLALWGGRRLSNNHGIARLLVSRGATYDMAVASALGDLDGVRRMLDAVPSRIRQARPCGRRPLAAAVEFGRDDIARLLLEHGADPVWDEPAAPRGSALHSASAWGNFAMVKLLLEHGADPNEEIDSAASAIDFAATPEIRELLAAHGAVGDPHALGDDERLRRAVERSRQGAAAFLAIPDADRLRKLLARGASPDLMNWQCQTIVHLGDVERAAMVLDAGANISTRDDEYRSTPLAWAARTNALPKLEFLLSRGAPVNLPDDEPWATPLAWATRRGHSNVVDRLRAAGARS